MCTNLQRERSELFYGAGEAAIDIHQRVLRLRINFDPASRVCCNVSIRFIPAQPVVSVSISRTIPTPSRSESGVETRSIKPSPVKTSPEMPTTETAPLGRCLWREKYKGQDRKRRNSRRLLKTLNYESLCHGDIQVPIKL